MIKPNEYTTMRLHKMWHRTVEREFEKQKLRNWNEAATDAKESASRRLRGNGPILSKERKGKW